VSKGLGRGAEEGLGLIEVLGDLGEAAHGAGEASTEARGNANASGSRVLPLYLVGERWTTS